MLSYNTLKKNDKIVNFFWIDEMAKPL